MEAAQKKGFRSKSFTGIRPHNWILVFAALAVIAYLLAQLGLVAWPRTQEVTGAVCGKWQSSAAGSIRLREISAVSSNNVWAIGRSSRGERTKLTYHWDGNKWNNVPIPKPEGSRIAAINSIQAISANDVWAVGFTAIETNTVGSTTQEAKYVDHESLILRQNGKEWSIMAPPNLGALGIVDGIGSNNVWVSGENGFAHWDGSLWNTIPNPSTGYVFSFSAASSNDVWGLEVEEGEVENEQILHVLHWDGSNWTVISANDIGAKLGYIRNWLEPEVVEAISPNDVWIMGNTFSEDALTMHWDGKSWNVVPNPATGQDSLHAIAAIASDDVWAVGDRSFDKQLVMHWDGKEWSIVPGPEPMNLQHLFGVTVAGPNEIWAIGWMGHDEDSGQYPLVSRFTRTACP